MTTSQIRLKKNGRIIVIRLKDDIAIINGQEIGYVKNGFLYNKRGDQLGCLKPTKKVLVPPPLTPAIPDHKDTDQEEFLAQKNAFTEIKNKLKNKIFVIIISAISLFVVLSLLVFAKSGSFSKSSDTITNKYSPVTIDCKMSDFYKINKVIEIKVRGRLNSREMLSLILIDPRGKSSRIGSISKDDLSLNGECELEAHVRKGKNTLQLRDRYTEKVVYTKIMEVP